jgi:hypothetical protein
MTKNRIISAIAALSLLAVPAVAAAHGGNDDHGHHKGRHHHKHHAKKARDVTGSATGTIASFTNGELTITLASGKSFAADVKRRTTILCKSAPVVPTPATAARHGNDDGTSGSGRGGNDDGANHDAGDDHGNDGATTTAPASTTTPSTTVPAPTTGDDHGDDDHNDDHGARCGTDVLVAGARVAVAKLSLKDGNATWTKVVVLK